MTNDNIPATAAASDRTTALATAAVALLIVVLIVAGPAALAFAELIAHFIAHLAVVVYAFQMDVVVHVSTGVVWLVTLQWI
jgi:hypothetical protein